MQKTVIGVLAGLGLMASGAVAEEADMSREAIAKRLAPVGELCLKGQPCGDAAAESAAGDEQTASSENIDAAGIYGQVCTACHSTGVAGAPKRGDADAWGPRLEKGMDTLYSHAINGFNAMPPKGGNPALSDAEVRATVDYIVAPVE